MKVPVGFVWVIVLVWLTQFLHRRYSSISIARHLRDEALHTSSGVVLNPGFKRPRFATDSQTGRLVNVRKSTVFFHAIMTSYTRLACSSRGARSLSARSPRPGRCARALEFRQRRCLRRQREVDLTTLGSPRLFYRNATFQTGLLVSWRPHLVRSKPETG